MNYRLVKRKNDIGWDWYLESDDCSSLVSPLAKEVIETLEAENAKLRKLCGDIYGEYRYLRVRFHRTYVQHEERMRAIEQRMRELGVEVPK